MHKLIRVIAEGENEEEAKNNAEGMLDDFIEWKYFDYYATEEDRIKSWRRKNDTD